MTADTFGRQEWGAVARSIEQMADTVIDGDPMIDSELVRTEGYRYLTRLLAVGALWEVELDPADPVFVRSLSPWLNYGLPHPDAGYLQTMVDGRYSYRILGQRGTAHLFDIEIYSGDMSDLSKLHHAGYCHDFVTGPDGELEVFLGGERRGENWLALPEGRSLAMIRQFFYDWDTEVPCQVIIEREGAEYPPPPARSQDVAAGLRRFQQYLTTAPLMLAAGARQHYQAPPDSVPFPPITMGLDREMEDQIGHAAQFYGQGHYRCGPDEAVVLEFTPPPCFYWSLSLASQYWESLDWFKRVTSVNGYQAVLDDDGVFRAVIAHQDPGVANWLDAGGREMGLLAVRIFEPKTDLPTPTLRTVPAAKLLDALPAATTTVSSDERQDALRRRRLVLARQGFI